MVEYRADGVMLNLRVDDVDAEYARLLSEGVEPAMPLEDTKSLNHFSAQLYQKIALCNVINMRFQAVCLVN